MIHSCAFAYVDNDVENPNDQCSSRSVFAYWLIVMEVTLGMIITRLSNVPKF